MQLLPDFLCLLGRVAVIRRMYKQIRAVFLLPKGQFLLPGVEPAQVILQHIAADETHQRVVGGDQSMHRQLGFFLLGIAHGGAVGKGVMHRPAVEDYTFLMIHLFNLFSTHHKPHAKSNIIHTIFYKNSIGW